MRKEIRLKSLKRLSDSDLGDAVIDFFEEESRDLKNGSNYDSSDFEIDGKASIKAAAKIDKLIYLLNSFKKSKEKSNRPSYK